MDTLPAIAHLPQALAVAFQGFLEVGHTESSLPVVRLLCVTEPS